MPVAATAAALAAMLTDNAVAFRAAWAARNTNVTEVRWLTAWLFVVRHATIAVCLFPVESTAILAAYVGCAALFEALLQVWAAQASRIANAKFPLRRGDTRFGADLYALAGDYSSTVELRLLAEHKLWELLLVLPPAVGAFGGESWGLTVAAGVAACHLLVLGGGAWGLRVCRLELQTNALADLELQLAQLAPKAVLHVSGPRSSSQDVNLWLSSLSKLGGEVLIVVRERHHLDGIRHTPAAVVFVDTQQELARCIPASVRMVMYISNAPRNEHLLERLGTLHVYIGRGDDVEVLDSPRVMRMYDQVWVAREDTLQRLEARGVEIPDNFRLSPVPLAPVVP